VQKAGRLLAVYHFLEHGNADAQAANIASFIGDKSIPVHIDCEPTRTSHPTWGDVKAFRAACERRGLKVASVYLTESYHGSMGSPSLRGYRLWRARYLSSRYAYGSALYTGDHDGRIWGGFGGVTPTLMQFASSCKITGYSGRVDVNAFRGTLDDLRALGLFKDYSGKDVPVTPAPRPQASAPANTGKDVADLAWDQTFPEWGPDVNDPGTLPAWQLLQQAQGYSQDGFNRVKQLGSRLDASDKAREDFESRVENALLAIAESISPSTKDAVNSALKDK
jgi:hypothetical protein